MVGVYIMRQGRQGNYNWSKVICGHLQSAYHIVIPAGRGRDLLPVLPLFLDLCWQSWSCRATLVGCVRGQVDLACTSERDTQAFRSYHMPHTHSCKYNTHKGHSWSCKMDCNTGHCNEMMPATHSIPLQQNSWNASVYSQCSVLSQLKKTSSNTCILSHWRYFSMHTEKIFPCG